MQRQMILNDQMDEGEGVAYLGLEEALVVQKVMQQLQQQLLLQQISHQDILHGLHPQLVLIAFL